MQTASKRLRHDGTTAEGADGTVVFDVGGRLFKVLRQTVEARPSTLLAILIDDLGTDANQHIFVHANPDRFAYILDWYRYGQMYVPTRDFPTEALLRDARFFLLPDTVKINGVTFSIRPSLVEEVRNEVINSVASGWPNFEQCLQDMLADVKTHFIHLGEGAANVRELPDSTVGWQIPYTKGHEDANPCTKLDLPRFIFPPKEFRLSTREHVRLGFRSGSWHRWLDPENIGSKGRLYLLVRELEKRGFSCNFKESTEEFVLQVGLGFDLSPGSQRVHIAGVETHNGCLPVTEHRGPAQASQLGHTRWKD